MMTFPIQIVTPDGLIFEGLAERLFCRTIAGDVCILARHCDYMTALGMGEARLTLADGTVRRAACIGAARLVATTWEWAENIDKARAEASRKRAEEMLARKELDARELEMAQARLKRALVRTSVAR